MGATIIVILFYILYYLFYNFRYEIKQHFIIFFAYVFKPNYLNTKEKIFLKTNCSFYKYLDVDRKIIFDYRVNRLKKDIDIIFRGNVKHEAEKKLIILANQVKLTFGLKCFKFDIFERIIVYPTEYESYYSKELHIGETNPGLKTIVLSWEDVCDGIKIKKDNLNVAIHELTHALYFSMKNNLTCGEEFLKKHKLITDYIAKHKETFINDNIIRAYAFTNKYETVPVLMEHFFENPAEFKEHYEILYNLMVNLIHQDPLNNS